MNSSWIRFKDEFRLNALKYCKFTIFTRSTTTYARAARDLLEISPHLSKAIFYSFKKVSLIIDYTSVPYGLGI